MLKIPCPGACPQHGIAKICLVPLPCICGSACNKSRTAYKVLMKFDVDEFY
jgi:hypothetical protein